MNKENKVIQENDVKYIISPESGKTVCFFIDNQWLFEDFRKYPNSKLIKNIVDMMIDYMNYYGQISKCYSPKAIATCDERDEYDEGIGKDIALAKLNIKYHNRMFKSYGAIVKILEDTLLAVKDAQRDHKDKAYIITKSIEKYQED